MSLTQDPIIQSQQFCCLSYVLPNSNSSEPNSKITAIKVRGSYATLDEAKAASAELQKIDPYFHIFVGQVGLWLPLDGDIENIKEQIYYEEPLNHLINGEVARANEAKSIEEQRRRDLAAEASRQKSSSSSDSNNESEASSKKTKTVEQVKQEEQEEKEKFEKLQEDLKSKESKLCDFEKKLDEIMKLQKSMKNTK